jgi:MFS transporter, AAHS family, benzoate transport protein
MKLLKGTAGGRTRSRLASVVCVCVGIAVMDGFDVTIFGAVVPSLLKAKVWGLSAAGLGLIGSLSPLGLMIGAILVGTLSDSFGRRTVLLSCFGSFAALTMLCAVAPNAWIFGTLRLLAGLGFGGALPSAFALIQDYSPRHRRQFMVGVISSSGSVGSVLAAIVTAALIQVAGWQEVFLVGGGLGIALVPVAFFLLPESITFLTVRGRFAEASALADKYGVQLQEDESVTETAARGEAQDRSSGLRQMFRPGFRLATVLFAFLAACALFVQGTEAVWLSQILISNGYGFGSGIAFLGIYYAGYAIGAQGLGYLADRIGSRTIIAISFACHAVLISLLVVRMPGGLAGVLVLLAGMCAVQNALLAGFAGVYYPGNARGNAFGLVSGVGRISGVLGPTIVGALIGAGFAPAQLLFVLAAVAVVGAVVTPLVPRNGVSDRFRAQRKEAARPEPGPRAGTMI